MKSFKFKLYDTQKKETVLAPEGCLVDYFIRLSDGPVCEVVPASRFTIIAFTEQKTQDGAEIYDGDIVDFVLTTNGLKETMTDHVHWHDGGWRVGNFSGVLADYFVTRIRGNVRETIWPLERPLF